MRPYQILLLTLLIVGIIPYAVALPTTNAASLVGNNNFTLSATGCASDICHFRYGLYPDRLMVWTSNKTASGGVASTTEYGSPIQTNTKYYATACDSTGCGNTISFTTLPYTPLTITTLGSSISNLTESRYNALLIMPAILEPYAWLFPTTAKTLAISIVCGLMFFALFVGIWRRTKSVDAPVILGILVSSSLLFSNRGLNLGIPEEFQAIAQALLYASIAGIFLKLLKR